MIGGIMRGHADGSACEWSETFTNPPEVNMGRAEPQTMLVSMKRCVRCGLAVVTGIVNAELVKE